MIEKVRLSTIGSNRISLIVNERIYALFVYETALTSDAMLKENPANERHVETIEGAPTAETMEEPAMQPKLPQK